MEFRHYKKGDVGCFNAESIDDAIDSLEEFDNLDIHTVLISELGERCYLTARKRVGDETGEEENSLEVYKNSDTLAFMRGEEEGVFIEILKEHTLPIRYDKFWDKQGFLVLLSIDFREYKEVRCTKAKALWDFLNELSLEEEEDMIERLMSDNYSSNPQQFGYYINTAKKHGEGYPNE